MSVDITELWFKRAVPKPTDKNRNVQYGVHLEESVEQLSAIKMQDTYHEGLRHAACAALEALATALKKGETTYEITNRKEFLDGGVDQIVTSIGSLYVNGMQGAEALNRVNASNFSKFDINGMPIFDENGKIAKNKATYFEPNLEGLY